MNDPFARGHHSPDATREWLSGREDRGRNLRFFQAVVLG